MWLFNVVASSILKKARCMGSGASMNMAQILNHRPKPQGISYLCLSWIPTIANHLIFNDCNWEWVIGYFAKKKKNRKSDCFLMTMLSLIGCLFSARILDLMLYKCFCPFLKYLQIWLTLWFTNMEEILNKLPKFAQSGSDLNPDLWANEFRQWVLLCLL
jgi:hypothetical protein